MLLFFILSWRWSIILHFWWRWILFLIILFVSIWFLTTTIKLLLFFLHLYRKWIYFMPRFLLLHLLITLFLRLIRYFYLHLHNLHWKYIRFNILVITRWRNKFLILLLNNFRIPSIVIVIFIFYTFCMLVIRVRTASFMSRRTRVSSEWVILLNQLK